jgi:hypothetical protein
MMPLVGVPETVRRGLAPDRDVFCRAEGFDHVSRYVTGRILSPNKTLQGIYEQLPENLSRKDFVPIMRVGTACDVRVGIFVVLSRGDPPHADPQTALS